MSRKSVMAEDSSAPIPGERRGTRPHDELSDTDESQVSQVSQVSQRATKPVAIPDDAGATVADDSPLIHEASPFAVDVTRELNPPPVDEMRVPTTEHPIPATFAVEPTPADTPLATGALPPDDAVTSNVGELGEDDSDVQEISHLSEVSNIADSKDLLEMQEFEKTSASPSLATLEQSQTSEDAPADSPEHTTIDGELMDKLDTSDTSHGASSRDSGRVGKPRRGTGVDEVLDASQISELPPADASGVFDESHSRSKNDKPGSTLILEGEEHRKRLEANVGDQSAASQLGPAFPDNDEDGPRSSEAKTSARPGVAQQYRGDGPREGKTRGSGSVTGDLPNNEDDGWSDFQEPSDDWGQSDSVSEAKPHKRDKDTNEQPKRRRDTGRFKPQEREHPEPVVRLVAVSAEDKGSIEVPSDDVTVGRESDNLVVLKDPSISRKHARLTRTEDGWDLTDLQSGNGTFINGKRIERGLVKNNDEIRFGSATFKFVDTSDGMRPVDASAAPILSDNKVAFFTRLRENPRLQTIVYGSSALCVVLLITLAVMIVRNHGNPNDPQVFQFYLQGVEHFKQRKWDAAEGFFAAALQRDHEHQRSRRYLDAISNERRAEQALTAAKDKLNVSDLSAAYEQALLASDSLFYSEDASKILVLVAKNAEDRILAAKSALAADDKAKARGLLEGLEFYSAYRADMNELRRQAGLTVVGPKSENILTQDVVIQQPPDKRRVEVVSGGTATAPAAKTDGPAQPKQNSMLGEAMNVLAAGNIDRAADMLESLPDSRERSETLDRLHRFAQAYDQGAEELKVKRADGAIRSLTEAVKFLDRLTGRRGELSKKVCGELADALYLKGVEQYHNNQVEAAEATLKQATSYSQGHQQSANLLTKISQERGGR